MTLMQNRSPYRVADHGDELVIDLPSPRRPVTAFVVSLWLLGWSVGLAFVAQQFQSGEPTRGDDAFLGAWLVLWLAAGVLAIAWLAWLVAGRERVTLTPEAIRIRRGVLAWGFTRSFALAGMSELRTFGREVPPLLAAGLDFAGRGASGVRFRHGGRVVRFARALDEPAGHALVDLLRSRLAIVPAHEAAAPPAGGERRSQPAA
ncbi:MAG TPA: hypothetical protein VMH61_06035 [Candidatus Acidoferrales bacterium]|nr:hypothetical protein [Candidatus Acidoferrales bacterium]